MILAGGIQRTQTKHTQTWKEHAKLESGQCYPLHHHGLSIIYQFVNTVFQYLYLPHFVCLKMNLPFYHPAVHRMKHIFQRRCQDAVPGINSYCHTNTPKYLRVCKGEESQCCCKGQRENPQNKYEAGDLREFQASEYLQPSRAH